MIDSLARVHPKAEIGENVSIGPFSTIHEDVVIGHGTTIYSNATVMPGARIGENCRIFPGAVISGIPQDLKFKGEQTVVEIGDRTTIRECATINRGTSALGKTVIGNDCLIMAYCHVAHDCVIGNHCIFSNVATLSGHIHVGDYVTISGLTAVHQYCRIGDYAFIAGGSLVRMDVPPYIKVAREPLTYMGINSVRLERLGFTLDDINELQNIYRFIYQGNYNLKNALDNIQSNFPKSREARNIISFFENTSRGVIR
ncbi:MAG: acyl-ACP--UDP-N-acetylglucosamine O-acyltransferase [Flavobacteriaceae bacterium]|nr:acyl-ACP--UDP-N-acetylglucosamine O-acyltransferase [Flavobacteriaceae bacterium]MCY4215446.1 acyl-ACP--UDP-N-acetylglucosamine O-acyltransferase [Flavobacteriaceae bacterium]MCY4254351.1 acyl-ACP--UDP-N-acetylglucosamine O-acyltransferase [Flavobacteriaceae bacterium]